MSVEANLRLGQAYYVLGDYRRAIDFLTANLKSLQGDRIRERFGLPLLPSVVCRQWLVWSRAELGEFAEGINLGEEAARIAEAANQPASLASAYVGIGELHLRKGDLKKAIHMLERSLELCKVTNIPLFFPHAAMRLGYAYALAGQVADALPLLEQAVEQMQSRFLHSSCFACLSETYLLAGRMEHAMDLAKRALELSREYKERGSEAYALRLLGEIASHSEPPDAETAESSYRQAIALGEELGMRPLSARCHLGLGRLYGRIGKLAEARSELSAAIELFRSMEMTFWLPQAESELARLK